MVKLYVPFLFSSHKVRYQTHPAPRIEIQSKLSCTSLEKREWNGGIGVCAAMKATQTLSFAQKHCRYLCCSGATRFKRLGLSNLVARTEYHTQLVLSTLIWNFSGTFFAVKFFLPDSCTLYRHSRLRLCKIHQFPLAFDRYLCYYSSCSTATPHLAAAFWQQGGSQGCSVSKEAL